MPFEIIRNDITKVRADAIVNAANSSLLGGGGVDGAIHRAAGAELLAECRTLGGCRIGEAKITKGYNLPAKYVIHTVGPVWQGGKYGEEKLLTDCYKNSFKLAKAHKVKSIAFPLISAGAFGYPKDEALKIGISSIGEFLLKDEMRVLLVVYEKSAFMLSGKVFSSITQYIDDRYVDEHTKTRNSILHESHETMELLFLPSSNNGKTISKRKRKLDDVINNMDETFSQMLLRLIDEKGMTDTETYKRANVDRRLFSKIRNDADYRPSKQTTIAFAIALCLNLDETKDLLMRAGFALSHSSKSDIIIEYFIEEGNYNIFEINEVLFAFDQNLLGI